MNQDQWMSLLRTVGAFFGGILVAKGVMSETSLSTLIDQTTEAIPVITGFVATITPIAAAIWGVLKHSDANKVLAAAGVKDTHVVVGPDADTNIKQMAANPAVKDVVLER